MLTDVNIDWNFASMMVEIQRLDIQSAMPQYERYVMCAYMFSTILPFTLLMSFVFSSDQDGAEPSPNSVAASNLQRLSAYVAKPVDPTPEAIYMAFSEMMSEHPVAIPQLVAAYSHHLTTAKQVLMKVIPSLHTLYG